MLFIVVLAGLSCRKADVVPEPEDACAALCDQANETEPTDPDQVAVDCGANTVPELSGALDDFPCASGVDSCASEGPYLGDTCCSYGPALTEASQARGSEVVDLESDGRYVVACGGFGADISDLSDPDNPQYLGGVESRCQRMAMGPQRTDGSRVFYLAHHGDSWVQTPYLASYRITPDGNLDFQSKIEEPDVLFEGMFWADDVLYVATHAGGVQIYRTDASGIPGELLATLFGFENALKLDLQGEFLYVSDDEQIQSVWIADPANPQLAHTTSASGQIRDIDATQDKVWVALGGGGVEVFERNADGSLSGSVVLDTQGSAQAVSASDDLVAIAAWTHVQIRDAQTLTLLGSKKTRPYREFEQDFGVVMVDERLWVAEWEEVHILDYHPGMVSPDIWLSDELFDFWGEDPTSRAVDLENRGPLPLTVEAIAADDPAFRAEPSTLVVQPGESASFTLFYDPPASLSVAELTICTNDADAEQDPVELAIYTNTSERLNVGEKLTDQFAFLDPTATTISPTSRGTSPSSPTSPCSDPICGLELPETYEAEIWQEYDDQGVLVYGIHNESDVDLLADFVEQTGATFPVVRDEGTFGLFSYPEGAGYPYPQDVIIGKDLTIHSIRNSFSVEESEELIVELLAE